MFSQYISYPTLQENPLLFLICFGVVLAFSFALFFLSRWRVAAAVVACLITFGWIVSLLPDIGDYIASRSRTEDTLYCPAPRSYYLLGYFLIFMPAGFVAYGVRALRRKNI